MVEKPKQGTAPSNLAISGRYILSPSIFPILENQPRGAGGEIQLTDAMVTLQKSEPFFAHVFYGRVHDTGTKLGFLTANLAYALEHDEFGPELRDVLRTLL
jgi:UTP--glucose-1-phosphate uridylyltransferase